MSVIIKEYAMDKVCAVRGGARESRIDTKEGRSARTAKVREGVRRALQIEIEPCLSAEVQRQLDQLGLL